MPSIVDNMGNKIYYSDRESKPLVNERRLSVRNSYLLTISMLIVYSIPFVLFSIQGWSSSSINTRAYILLMWIIGIFFGYFGLHYIFIVDNKNALKYGISLTDDYLQISEKKIMVDDIIKAEMVRFPEVVIFLAIKYKHKVREKEKINTYLLRENKTDNIFLLSNMVRKLISLPEQTDPRRIKSWVNWKKEL